MKTFTPKARVTITTDKSTYDVSYDIASLATNKIYGTPEGSFALQLAASNRYGSGYEDLFNPNDKIKIECNDGTGSESNTVMIGLLSQIEKTFTITGNGQPLRRVNISGSDMGKVLAQHHCQWYAAPRKENIGSEASITSLVYGAQLYSGGTPARLAKLLLEKELFERMPWTKEYISDDLINSTDTWTLNNAGISMHSTVLDALRYVSNEPYNKLSGDTRNDGEYHVILEKCPFNNTTGKLERSTLKTIEPELVISSNVGKNDHDRITYLWLKTLVGAFGEPGGHNLLMLKGDAQQFTEQGVIDNGFRPWFPESRFSPFSKTGEPQLQDSLTKVQRPIKERTDALWTWYKDNHTYLSGNITLHGSTDIRAGDGVLFEGNEYFVEAVNHKCAILDNGVSYRTMLHVTRGQKHA
jgi:hypothetical protein